MKKALALITACAIGLSLLAGCGTAAPSESEPAAEGANTASGDKVVIGYSSNIRMRMKTAKCRPSAIS